MRKGDNKMRLPDVTSWVREVPVRALRTVFAGLGNVLLTAEEQGKEADSADPAGQGEQPRPARTRRSDRADASDAEPADPLGAEETGKTGTQRWRSLDTTGNVRLLRPDEAAAQQPGGASLPVPGYDGLSIASLRARLRTLDVGQLGTLIEYEKANAQRDDVISMFERRIAKLRGEA
jgi:hypothetical protein